jgi:hypothetical protein
MRSISEGRGMGNAYLHEKFLKLYEAGTESGMVASGD